MKKKKVTCFGWLNRFSVLLLACLFVLQGHASDRTASIDGVFEAIGQQDKSIEGKIVDDAEFPLPGVSVLVKGTTTGTTTDVDGVFKLSVPDNAVIVISYVGFHTQQITVGSKTFFSISLKEDARALDEVVVVGYTTQRKADLTGAVSSVKMSSLNDMSVSGINSALQGRMSGVTVLQSSGAPGAGTSIRIRGAGTFGNNEPLYVIDGMPAENMNDINPSDIERIDVLKDAASAAIYGSRAANGVVIIQTKKGGKSNKVNIVFNTYQGFSKLQRKLGVLDAKGRNLIHTEAYGNDLANGFITQKQYDTGTQYYSTPDAQISRTDWQDEIFASAAYQANYDISLSGGSEKFKYNIMGAHLSQDGLMKNADYNRTTLRINTELELAKGLIFGENLMIAKSKQKVAREMGSAGAIASALQYDPSVPVYDPTGEFVYSGSGPLGADIRNPVSVSDRQDRKRDRDRIFGNMFLQYTFLNDFTIKTDFGYDWSSWGEKWFVSKSPEPGNASNQNELTERLWKTERWLNTTTIKYDKTIGSHKFMVLGGHSYEHFGETDTNYRGRDFVSEDKDQRYIEAAGAITWLKGTKNEWKMESVFARLDYAFADRYLLSANFRADGSSKFGKNNRWGYFPSVSAGWRISEENFFQPLKEKAIQSMKFRASWGQLGNQNIANFYPTLVAIDATGNNMIFGEKETSSIGRFEASIANEDIKWEVTTQTDLGIDISFLNHFDFGFDYFIKKSKDVLAQPPMPSLPGVTSAPWINTADVKNHGFEANLSYNTKINGFNINAYGNFSKVKNEVTSLGVGKTIYPTSYRGGSITRTLAGESIGHFYGYKTDGIFRTQQELDKHVSKEGKLLQPNARVGDLKFIDKNGDGSINANDMDNIGNGFPDFTYGFGADLEYKGIDLSFFFQGVAGYDIFNALKYEGMFVSPRYNQFSRILDRFHSTANPNGSLPGVTTQDKNNNRRFSDYYIDKGDYLRLKTLTIGYTLNKSLTNKINLQKVRFYATAQNLFTITSYKGFDPELGETFGNELNNDSGMEMGVDRGQFPQTRSFIFGVNINF